MEAANSMRLVLNALRGTRALAIETLKREFSDLYALSTRAFEAEEAGGIAHHARLGEYLTEWNNQLGRSPVEALASGGYNEVRRELAERSSLDPESVVTDVSEPSHIPELQSQVAPAYLAYCNYYATGEGVTVMLAAGGTEDCTRIAFLEHAPDYFHRGIELQPICEEASSESKQMIRWIPQPVLDLVAKNPPGTTYFYSKLHFNLA